jgi:hypothetical protein
MAFSMSGSFDTIGGKWRIGLCICYGQAAVSLGRCASIDSMDQAYHDDNGGCVDRATEVHNAHGYECKDIYLFSWAAYFFDCDAYLFDNGPT